VDGWVGSIRILQEIGKGILSRSFRRILSRRSGVERRAAPIPECVLSFSYVERMRVGVREWLRAPAIEITIYQHCTHINYWRWTYIPATSCWTILAACKANSGSELPIWKITFWSVTSTYYIEMEARTVRFLDWVSREDGPLTFRICDHTRLRYFISESQSCGGLRSTTRSEPMIARSTTSGDHTKPAP
jgi:hypothetical protein